jgi:hypothetical protein
MRLRARAVAGWAVGTCLVSWALSACLSPTLPLPPPGAPEIAELNADGQTVRIVGHAVGGADVTATNVDTPGAPGLLVFADSRGVYVFEKLPVDLSVTKTNRIDIWQAYGPDRSDGIRVRVPYGVAFGAAPSDDAGASTTTPEAGPLDAGSSDAAE